VQRWGIQMTSEKAAIQTAELSKRFGRIQALEKLDLSVKAGIFGLIGPNGAGKTTLLRILLGLSRQDSGRATVLGLDTRNQSIEIRRRVGVLHEKPSFVPFMTCVEYLKGVAGIYGADTDPRDLLSTVGLDDAYDRPIGELSAGMNQRLGIAQALVGNPELVFLDEPTSNLDVDGRDEIIRLIVDLNADRGVSFFIASHVLSELERACGSVAFIRAGRIVESGGVREIIEEWTKRTFRVVCSEPKRLRESLRELVGVSSSVAGVNTLTVSVSSEGLPTTIKQEVERIAKAGGITIHAVERATSLEEAYKEVMRSA
jgi:ABC-type multidrug transport system ATPase subunit